MHVDRFEIDYREDGSERQFSSDLSVVDPATGRTLSRQHISVNKPLRWGGVTGCAAHIRLSARCPPHARSRSAHQGSCCIAAMMCWRFCRRVIANKNRVRLQKKIVCPSADWQPPR